MPSVFAAGTEMGLHGQNSWVRAGGRRLRKARLCSCLVMGTIRSIEQPLSLRAGQQPRIWNFLLAGGGAPLGRALHRPLRPGWQATSTQGGLTGARASAHMIPLLIQGVPGTETMSQDPALLSM